MNNEKLTFNLREAAEALGVSHPVMMELVNRREFPAMRVGRRWLIPRATLEAWVADNAVNRRTLSGGERGDTN